jgi:hypothetical protein
MTWRTVIECAVILAAASVAVADDADSRLAAATDLVCYATAQNDLLSPHQWMPEYERYRMLAGVQLDAAEGYLEQAGESLKVARGYQRQMMTATTSIDRNRYASLYYQAWCESISYSESAMNSARACCACVRSALDLLK